VIVIFWDFFNTIDWRRIGERRDIKLNPLARIGSRSDD
jgi:hypothetical protein